MEDPGAFEVADGDSTRCTERGSDLPILGQLARDDRINLGGPYSILTEDIL